MEGIDHNRLSELEIISQPVEDEGPCMGPPVQLVSYGYRDLPLTALDLSLAGSQLLSNTDEDESREGTTAGLCVITSVFLAPHHCIDLRLLDRQPILSLFTPQPRHIGPKPVTGYSIMGPAPYSPPWMARCSVSSLRVPGGKWDVVINRGAPSIFLSGGKRWEETAPVQHLLLAPTGRSCSAPPPSTHRPLLFSTSS
ncbi:unnamed protein product [Arctogadus glacialis]